MCTQEWITSQFRYEFDIGKVIGWAEDGTPCKKIAIKYETSHSYGH